MGNSPVWYKQGVILALILNPLIFFITKNPQITGWLILVEFIATLALALKCYPLIPGGLIALEAAFLNTSIVKKITTSEGIKEVKEHIHMVTPHGIYHEVEANLEVILLLLFMVAGIHFMKDLLSWVFTKIIVGIRSKYTLSLTFAFVGAFLSAWLDALTVTAVMIAVAIAFYNIYTSASLDERVPGDLDRDKKKFVARQDLDNFGGFLRNLLMHGVVGTAMGGVATQVGEPQNLIIASKMDWDFVKFYLKIAHISIPILLTGLVVTVLVERFKIVGYGYRLPDNVRAILKQNADKMRDEMDTRKRWALWIQGVGAIWLVVALALHLAEVGLIGLSVVVFLTAMLGKTDENTIGHAFEEATPFTSLLVIFFVVVGMIEETHLFEPIIKIALDAEGSNQTYIFFFASGILSAISDNVFVGTIYIKEAYNAFVTPENLKITKEAFEQFDSFITAQKLGVTDEVFKSMELASKKLLYLKVQSPKVFEQLENVAAAINVGTNIPSIATPNGQAAFLFLLTNAIAARINLSYIRMVKMALPYFIVITSVAALFLLLKWLPV